MATTSAPALQVHQSESFIRMRPQTDHFGPPNEENTMSPMRHVAVTILCLGLWAGSLPAQTGARERSPGSAVVVARRGGYQLTEQMLEQALQFAQILAAKDFSPSDAAALRADLIASFQKEPAEQTASYESVAQWLQRLGIPGRKPSWLDLAIARYNHWQSVATNPQWLRGDAASTKMILKYNPVLVNWGGMIVTKNDVDCQFYSDTMVARAAGVAPPTETDKDQFIRNLPFRFASMPAEQKEYLREAEIRLAQFHMVYDSTIKTHAAVLGDIRQHVHSSTDVSREARQVEKDADSGAIAQHRAVDVESRRAVMEMHLRADRALVHAGDNAVIAANPNVRRVYRPDPAGAPGEYPRFRSIPAGAPGKYWQSYVSESNGIR